MQPLRELRITQLTNGNFLVSCADSFNLDDTSPGSDLIGQVFDPLGVPVGARIRVNTNFSDNESEADIAALPGGGFIVVYTDPSSAGDTIRWNIRSATGALVSNGTVDSVTGITTTLSQPEVVTNPDGSFAVIFREEFFVFPTNNEFTLTIVFDAAGNEISLTRGQVDDRLEGHDLTQLASGNFLAAEWSATDFSHRSSIALGIVVSDGQNTSANFIQGPTAASGVEFFDPQLAALTPVAGFSSTQRYVLVFTSDSGSRDDIIFSIYNGDRVIVDQRFVTSDLQTDNEPAAVSLPDGGFFIVWDDTNGRLEGQRFSATGELVGGELLLATGGISGPALALTTDGRILVTWSELGAVHSMMLDPRGNLITGTALNDVLVAPTENATVNGLSGIDRLFGSLFNDTLDGGTGNDTLFGRNGNDRLISGDENGSVFGGNGNDTMSSGAGNDFYDGGDGIDRGGFQTITAGVLIDLTAGLGTFGHAQTDRFVRVEAIIGSSFNDSIHGDGLANTLSGIGGNDTLNGLGGADDLSGSIGNDTLNGGAGGDVLNGGSDIDLVSYTSSAVGVIVDLRNGLAAFGDAAGDVFFSIEYLRGSAFNDTLTGNNGGTNVQAGLGNDGVAGGDGFDSLFGEGGNDTIFGGAGNDLLFGGDGNDVLFLVADTGRGDGDAGNDTINGSSGTDSLSGGSGTNTMIGGTASDSYFVISSTDVIVELAADIGPEDAVVASVDYTLAAGVAVERLLAFANTRANVTLTGNAFAQLIVGNLGDNTLITGSGAADTLIGGVGNGTYKVFNAADVVTEIAFQGTADRVQTAVSYTLQDTTDIEFLETAKAAGITAINLVGNALAQSLTGNAGVSNLNGQAGGTNTLIGLGGDDLYRIFNATDRGIEDAGQGTNDRVAVAVSYALDKFAQIGVMSTLNTAGVAADQSDRQWHQPAHYRKCRE